jgi:L-ascorbate metabolism protein UlaG (beta-lactamase superfamily)
MDRDTSREVLLMRALFVICAFALSACSFASKDIARVAPTRITQPARTDARLAVLWIGHATVLIQIDDKLILTDPFLVPTVGQFSRRVVDPGIDPANIPQLDAVVISHMHFDHMSLGSLELIEKKTPRLFVPQGGLVYVPNFAFDARELGTWKTFEQDGLRITAVPVNHVGWRYGIDSAWMTSFTGYLFEYHGIRVYFGGDTAYDNRAFKEAGARFPNIDLALLPIAPIHPRTFMKRVHMDPPEALDAFRELGAKTMIPIHFDTLVNGFDDPGEARNALLAEAKKRGVGEKVQLLAIGEQRVVIAR